MKLKKGRRNKQCTCYSDYKSHKRLKVSQVLLSDQFITSHVDRTLGQKIISDSSLIIAQTPQERQTGHRTDRRLLRESPGDRQTDTETDDVISNTPTGIRLQPWTRSLAHERPDNHISPLSELNYKSHQEKNTRRTTDTMRKHARLDRFRLNININITSESHHRFISYQ